MCSKVINTVYIKSKVFNTVYIQLFWFFLDDAYWSEYYTKYADKLLSPVDPQLCSNRTEHMCVQKLLIQFTSNQKLLIQFTSNNFNFSLTIDTYWSEYYTKHADKLLSPVDPQLCSNRTEHMCVQELLIQFTSNYLNFY